jgi:sphinganine-1-phosphate aldolase
VWLEHVVVVVVDADSNRSSTPRRGVFHHTRPATRTRHLTRDVTMSSSSAMTTAYSVMTASATTTVMEAALEPALKLLADHLIALDKRLHDARPSYVLIGAGVSATVAIQAFYYLLDLRKKCRTKGALWLFFESVKALPIVKGLIAAERGKMIAEMDVDMSKKLAKEPPRLTSLPAKGVSVDAVLLEAAQRKRKDLEWTPAGSLMSGAVYMADDDHFKMLSSVYASFAHSNPLHGDAFPAVVRMENEVVNMTATMLGCSPAGPNPNVCGLMTSGGTESILTAIRATRDYSRDVRGIKAPEMIVAISAHAAVYKAADYFGIELVRVGVDARFRMDVDAVRRAITGNTILIYASTPGYPHGAVDDVQALAAIAKKRKCCLHVDACLGGFVLPFASSIKPFDFRVDGVTSMSVDTHKYGLAQKGSSVVLYNSAALRQYQYTAVMDWSGGLYISPSQAGSRSGGLIAQTWAALMHMGREGYQRVADAVIAGARELRAGLSEIDGLKVLGEDVSMVVAWGSSDPALNIYTVNDVMVKKGWHLSVLQAPPALHMCLTSANVASVRQLCGDLAAAVKETRALGKGKVDGGKAPIYGLAGGLPDRGTVGDILKDVQDLMLKHV